MCTIIVRLSCYPSTIILLPQHDYRAAPHDYLAVPHDYLVVPHDYSSVPHDYLVVPHVLRMCPCPYAFNIQPSTMCTSYTAHVFVNVLTHLYVFPYVLVYHLIGSWCRLTGVGAKELGAHGQQSFGAWT